MPRPQIVFWSALACMLYACWIPRGPETASERSSFPAGCLLVIVRSVASPAFERTAGRKTLRSGLFRPGRVPGLSEPQCMFRPALFATVVTGQTVDRERLVWWPSLSYAFSRLHGCGTGWTKFLPFPGLQLADLTVLQPTQQIPNSKWVASLLPSLGLVSVGVWLKDPRASQLQPSFACCLTVLTDLLP